MSAETMPSSAEFDPARVHEVERLTLDALQNIGFDDRLLYVFDTSVLSALDITYDASKNSLFTNYGYNESGVSDDRFGIRVGGESIRNRAERLAGLVPEGTEEHIAETWIIAHELGHGLQAAYGIAKQYIAPEDSLWAGMTRYPIPADEYLKAHPDQKMAEGSHEAMKIDDERQAEGVASLVLASELQGMGMSEEEAQQVIEKALLPMKAKAESTQNPAQIGYANPLKPSELLERFTS